MAWKKKQTNKKIIKRSCLVVDNESDQLSVDEMQNPLVHHHKNPNQ